MANILYKGLAGDVVEFPPEQDQDARMMGYVPAKAADVNVENTKKEYGHWYDAPVAFGAGAIAGIPGLTATVNALAPEEYANNFNQNLQNYATANPATTAAGNVAGAVGSALALPVVAGAVAPGLAAGAVAGIGNTLGVSANAARLLGGAALGAAENAGSGIAYKFDQAALQHADTPEGQDKIFEHVGMDALTDAAIGAAIPVGAAALGKAFRSAGKALNAAGTENMLRANMTAEGIEKIAQQAKATPIATFLEQEGLLGVPAAKARPKIVAKIEGLEKQFNVIKSQATTPLDSVGAVNLENALGSALEGTDVKVPELLRGVAGDADLNVSRLHSIRQQLDAKIDWSDLTNPVAQKLNTGRDIVSNYINVALDANDAVLGGGLAQQWKNVNREYHYLHLVNSSMQKAAKAQEEQGLSWWLKPTGLVLGHALAGNLAFVAEGAAVLKRAYQTGRLGGVARSLGKVFTNADTALSAAVNKKFYGIGVLPGTAKPASAADYNMKTAKMRYLAGKQDVAVPAMAKALTEAGLPPEVSDPIVQRQVAIAQHLNRKMQRSPFATSVSQMPWKPSADSIAVWNGLYNTAHDPKEWIADPSPEKTEMAMIAYPGIVQKTREIVLKHLAETPEAPMQTRIWATQLIGAPVEPLMDPSLYAILDMARNQQQEAAPGAEAAGQSGSAEDDGINSESTHLDTLQGR